MRLYIRPEVFSVLSSGVFGGLPTRGIKSYKVEDRKGRTTKSPMYLYVLPVKGWDPNETEVNFPV